MHNILPRRKATLAALIIGSLLAIVVVSATVSRTQKYKGEDLQHWFKLLISESPTERQQAEAAFEALGENCNGYLLSQVTANIPTPIQRSRSWVEEKVLRRVTLQECGMAELDQAFLRQECLKRAYGILGNRGTPSIRRLGLLLSHQSCQTEAAASLVAIGPEALSEIESGLNSKDVGIRKTLVSALGGAQTQKDIVCDLLISALEDPDGLIRHYAAYALGELNVRPEKSVHALTASLKDSDPRVRYISLFALEKFGLNAAPACAGIRQLQNDPEENVRTNALEIANNLDRLRPPDLH